jgi:hypothetical protein
VGFFNPEGLLLGFSVAALVAIYLRSRARPTISVSSLMLFERLPAPVAKSRILRLDLFFWLELLALSALTLALAGLYFPGRKPVGGHQLHALIFDLGAGMGAVDGGLSRLDQARSLARRLVSAAPVGDRFTVIGYGLEASVVSAPSTDRRQALGALDQLRPLAIAPRPSALRAALIDAKGAATIDIFADRRPAQDLVREASTQGTVRLHQVGKPMDNVAIAELDPGVPRSNGGHCVLRNFSDRPVECNLEIDINGRQLVRTSLFIEPRAQAIVSFKPLPQGGLLHARITSRDALLMDNERFAVAPSITQANVLVLSPDADVRDDLARVALAINPNFVVTALDPALYRSNSAANRRYALAILHDCSPAGVNAAARMFVFPEPALNGSHHTSVVRVVGSVAAAELEARQDTGQLTTPTLLGPSRILSLPGWMDALALGTPLNGYNSFPVAGVGRDREGKVGVLAFDIRDHLLLDPDRLDALILTIDTLKRVIAPENIKVVSTGSFVSVSTFAPATLISPDNLATRLQPDQWGRVRFRPLEAGHYAIQGPNGETEVYANYYDAAESDLTSPARAADRKGWTQIARSHNETFPKSAGLMLIAVATSLVLAESVLIARRTVHWGIPHV